jgi:hypothetical protein
MALSTVKINFFLLRTIQQWMEFLAQHWITCSDCLPLIEDMRPIFYSLESHVHPAFDVCIGTITAIVNFCSHANRTKFVSEHLLH